MPPEPVTDPPGTLGEWFGGFVLTWTLAAVAASLVVVASGSADPDTDTPIPVLAGSLAIGWAVWVVGIVVASRRFGSGDPVADFALGLRRVDALGLAVGVVGQIAVVPLVYVPLRALWPDTFDAEALRETATDLVDRADGALLPLLFVVVVIGAPVFEELLYRGFLQRPLLGRLPTAAVLVGVAAIFALVHFRPVEYPGLFAAGLLFGVCAWWTGRIGPAIAAHVGFNLVGLVFAL